MRKHELERLAGLLQVAIEARIAVAHRVAIDGPCLPAAPHRLVGISLGRLLVAHGTVAQGIVHHVVATAIGAELVFQRLVGMAHGDAVVSRVARKLGGFKHQFEIHHVVDDDGAFPALLGLPTVRIVDVPRLDDASARTEAGGERLRCLHHHVLISLDVLQAQAVAETAVDDEAHVVVARQHFGRFDGARHVFRLLGPLLVASEFVEIPQGAGEEAATPVVRTAVAHFALLVERHGIERFLGFLDSGRFQSHLFRGKVNGFGNA